MEKDFLNGGQKNSNPSPKEELQFVQI